MCEGCKEIILEKKPVIRQAAFKHRNDFVEANDLISIIHVKFFSWKRKQEKPILRSPKRSNWRFQNFSINFQTANLI